MPKQQAGKAGWALVLLRELWPWSLSTAPLDEHWVLVWGAECSQLQLLCPEQCLHRLPHPRAAVSNSRIIHSTSSNAEHENFLKCWHFSYCPCSEEEERKNLSRINQFDFTVPSVYIWVSPHRKPLPQHLRHLLKTLLLCQDLNLLNVSCSVLFSGSTSQHFQQGTCTVSFQAEAR